VDEAEARAAGFDLEADKLRGRKARMLTEARQRVEAMWQAEQNAIRRGDYTPPPEAEEEDPGLPPLQNTGHLSDEAYRAVKGLD
jgi:hypothetical protein